MTHQVHCAPSLFGAQEKRFQSARSEAYFCAYAGNDLGCRVTQHMDFLRGRQCGDGKYRDALIPPYKPHAFVCLGFKIHVAHRQI